MSAESVTFVSSDGHTFELTREELSLSTRYAVIWMGSMEALADGRAAPDELFAKMIYLGAMLERGEPGITDKLIDVIVRIAEGDLEDFQKKTAKLVSNFVQPLTDDEWEMARTKFQQQNERQNRQILMEEKLYQREAKPFA